MTITVALTDTLERFVREQVETGRYGSPNEVVQEALRLLERHEVERREDAAAETAWLQEAWRQGIDSGPAGEFDPEAIRQEARRRLAATAGR